MLEQKKTDELAKGASPLVRQIISLLLEEIETLDKEEPLLPEMELAKKFGISRKTIRTAMKRLEDDGLIRRIKRKGTFPTKGRTCKPLFREKVIRIGLLSSNNTFSSQKFYQTQITMGILEKSFEKNCQILIAGGNNNANTADSIFRIAADATVDGLMLIGITDQTLLVDLEKWNKPICLLDHYSETESIDCVRTDSFKGSQLAVEHLYRLGHKKIGYADTADKNANPARHKGYLEGLKNWKLSHKKDWLFSTKESNNESDDIAMQFLALPPADRPTAIVAFSDSIANNIKNVLTKFGLNIPKDLSIIGTGGDLGIVGTGGNLGFIEKITNVCFDWKRLGQEGADLLIDRILNPRTKGKNIHISPQLEVGGSTSKI